MSTLTIATPASYSPPQQPLAHKRSKMTLSQSYYVAHMARAKLTREAQMPDHNLRKLVGHANLLDGLMIDLAEAEREEEQWFYSVTASSSSTKTTSQSTQQLPTPAASPISTSESRHIRWADRAVVAAEEVDDDEDSESEYDEADDEAESLIMSAADQLTALSATAMAIDQPTITLSSPSSSTSGSNWDDLEVDDEMDSSELQLHRTISRRTSSVSSASSSSSSLSTSAHSPPELLHADSDDSSSDSDEEPDMDDPLAIPPTPTITSMMPSTLPMGVAGKPAAVETPLIDDLYHLEASRAVAVY